MNTLISDTKLAIELEKKGYDFYMTTAQKTTNPLAKSTLESLAERELVHEAKIKEFYQDLTKKQKLPSDWLKGVEVPPKREQLLQPILKRLKAALNQDFQTEQALNEAYQIAEGLEKESYNLYTDIAKKSDDEITKKFYSALAQEEQEHYAILDETMQYLNNPGDWFKKEERWIVEG
ncbi:MAG: ferritin family protein [Candidatus Saganbacteria bacterium]|nr:ferritin family protein [Candidatus Saganbacteria bacterium]